MTDAELRGRGISESLVRKKQEREIAQRLQLSISDTQTAYKKPGTRKKQEGVGKGGGRSVNGRWVPDEEEAWLPGQILGTCTVSVLVLV